MRIDGLFHYVAIVSPENDRLLKDGDKLFEDLLDADQELAVAIGLVVDEEMYQLGLTSRYALVVDKEELSSLLIVEAPTLIVEFDLIGEDKGRDYEDALKILDIYSDYFSWTHGTVTAKSLEDGRRVAVFEIENRG